MPAFPLGRVAGAAALGGPKIPHDQQQSQIVLLAPHQDVPSKVGDVVTPAGPWTHFGPLSRGCSVDCSLKDLVRHSFQGHFGHLADLTQVWSLDSEKWLDILGFRPVLFVTKCHTENSSQISHLCRSFFWQHSFSRHQGPDMGKCRPRVEKCCPTHHHLLFLLFTESFAPPKVPPRGIAPLPPPLSGPWSSPKIDDHRRGSEQRPFKNWKLRVLWKLPFRHHGATKLTQNCVCFTNPCINPFAPTFVAREPQGTSASPPVAVYFRSLAGKTALGVCPGNTAFGET